MLTAVALLFVLPTLVTTSGEGNIHLLENEVATALRSCSYNESKIPANSDGKCRRSSSDTYDNPYKHQVSRINDTENENMNLRGRERQKSTKKIFVENDVPSYGQTDTSVKYVGTATTPSENTYNYNINKSGRQKRSGYLINNTDHDQCLSQCVFANLQVVDERGIPRETELWNKVQTTLTSQLSRTVLRDQMRSCFQELRSEEDGNGCYYSNQLERCLTLRFSDRKLNGTS